MDAEKLKRFSRAFTHVSGCRRTCACGKVYYENSDEWSWDEGELEALLDDPKAVALPHAVGSFQISGRDYVRDCDCWHGMAHDLIGFLDAYSHEIAAYLNGEKAHATAAAKSMPTVDA